MYENIYYSPEKFGLEVVGDFDWRDCDYEFDMLVVWKEKRGRYWVGEDSGCSCPSPFEDFKGTDDLNGPYTKEELRKYLDYRIRERAGDGSRWGNYSMATLKKSASEILSRIS